MTPKTRLVLTCCLLVAPMALLVRAVPVPVTLTTPTATFCQPSGGGPFTIPEAIDGSFSPLSGWAIDPQEGATHVAVLKTTADIGVGENTTLTFTLHMLYGANHLLGKFRLAATTSARATYGLGATCADATPGGSAVWTALHPTSALSANGQTLTVQLDESILSSGSNPATDVVTVQVITPLVGITGFRFEALTDATLPFNGPGRQPTNGNFVLTEIVVDADAAPIPSLPAVALGILAVVMAGLGVFRLRRTPHRITGAAE